MKKKFNCIDSEKGIYECICFCNGRKFVGEAHMSPNDKDMQSEKTGFFIAECRANIKCLKYIIQCELKPQIKILTHLNGNMKSSKFYQPKSYEAKMVQKQLYILQDQLTATQQDLVDEEQYLKKYIEKKEELYQRIRKQNASKNDAVEEQEAKGN